MIAVYLDIPNIIRHYKNHYEDNVRAGLIGSMMLGDPRRSNELPWIAVEESRWSAFQPERLHLCQMMLDCLEAFVVIIIPCFGKRARF